MKYSLIIIIFLITASAYSQKQIQVKSQKFESIGVSEGETVHKESRDLMVKLNYETGDINMAINMKNNRLISDDKLPRENEDDDLFKFTGRLPLKDILYNKQTDQNYTLELNISNRGKITPVLFNCVIKNYTGSNKGFRQFIMTTDINLPENSKELYGLEPTIKIIISFQMYLIGG